MRKGLITANTWFGAMQKVPGPMTFETWRKTNIARLRARFHVPEGRFDDTLEPVPAFVNKGRWIAVCPHCGGGEYAWEEGFFFCCSCLNSYMGHRYRRLVFPEDRIAIEDALAVRPLENRNWTIKETVADLVKENQDHVDELLVKPDSEPSPELLASLEDADPDAEAATLTDEEKAAIAAEGGSE